MVKIFETNILIKKEAVCDHQTRLIEEESWHEYIKNMKDGIYNNLGNKQYLDIVGFLDGQTIQSYIALKSSNISMSHNDHCCNITISQNGKISQYILSYLALSKED